MGVFVSLSNLTYPTILLNLFILGSAVAILQVTTNPYTLETNSKSEANSNLCFAQSFTNIGTILAPLLGSVIILLSPQNFAYVYLLVSLCFFLTLLYAHFAALPTSRPQEIHSFENRPKILFGFLAIAVSVGVEVSAASFLVKFLAEKNILDVNLTNGGFLTIFYWLGFFLGRSFGSILLKRLKPEKILFYHALGGLILATFVVFGSGFVAAGALLAMGFCISVFFPIIYALVIEGSESNKIMVSGVLCMGCVGGAIFTFIQGYFADIMGLQNSFLVSCLLFIFIIVYTRFLSLRTSTKTILAKKAATS